jgi:hypothetical protein
MTDIHYNSPKKMVKMTNNGLQDTTHTSLRLSNKYATKVWDRDFIGKKLVLTMKLLNQAFLMVRFWKFYGRRHDCQPVYICHGCIPFVVIIGGHHTQA